MDNSDAFASGDLACLVFGSPVFQIVTPNAPSRPERAVVAWVEAQTSVTLEVPKAMLRAVDQYDLEDEAWDNLGLAAGDMMLMSDFCQTWPKVQAHSDLHPGMVDIPDWTTKEGVSELVKILTRWRL